MHRRLGIALSFSALLIGGAALHRFAYAEKTSPYLAAADSLDAGGESTALSDTDLLPDTAATSTDDEKLTTTDLIGRQLFMDYLDLAQNGQATDANIEKLGDNYAANIVRLDTPGTYTPPTLSVVPDSKDSFKAYASAFSALYNSYTERAKINFSEAGDISDLANPNFSSAMKDMSSLYSKAAKDLAALPVPTSLVSAHQQLITLYMDNARALGVLSGIGTDPAAAYAALGTQAKNSQAEKDILAQIAGTLALNGTSLSLSEQ